MWPLNISDLPPPLPPRMPTTFGPPSSTPSHSTKGPGSAKTPRRDPPPAPFPGRVPDRLGPPTLPPLPLDGEPELGEDAAQVLPDRLLVTPRAGDVDEIARRLDEAAAVDLAGDLLHLERKCGSTSRPK